MHYLIPRKSIIKITGLLIPFVLLAQVERWVYRYNGPGNGTDGAHCIINGPDGYLYVTGGSRGTGSGMNTDDIVVMKLDTAGTSCWVYRYDGPGESSDAGYSIAYGADNNLYIAGRSGLWSEGAFNYDFMVISLDTAGNERWVYRGNGTGGFGSDVYFEKAVSIIYGADGNIYAAGTIADSATNCDFTVVSFTTSGSINWVYKYDGPGHGSDEARSIIYGPDNNLYVCGYSVGIYGSESFTIISLTTDGDQRWVWRQSILAYNLLSKIVYGADDNLYACGMSGDIWSGITTFSVVSVSSDGTWRWTYWHNTLPACYDDANSLLYGDDGNIYIVGSTFGSNESVNFTVISLDTAGTERWVYRYLNPGEDAGFSITSDVNGNLFAIGHIRGSSGTDDVALISLDPAGYERWGYQYNGPGNDDDDGWDIVYGTDGHLYLAGATTGFGTLKDFTIISLVDTLGGVDIKETARCNIKTSIPNLLIYPNPFKNATNIKFQIPNPNYQTNSKYQTILKIYNATGRMVKDFSCSKPYDLRSTQIIWDGTDDSGQKLPAGVYFCKFEYEKTTEIKKIIMLR